MTNDQGPSGSQNIVRIVLLLVLAVLIVAGVVDWRARTQSSAADQQLTEMDTSGEAPDATAVQNAMGREPTVSNPVEGGLIERYSYMGGIPGRTYTVSVGYAEDSQGIPRYVAHTLNKVEEEEELANVIGSQGQRVMQSSNEAELYGEGGGGNPGGGAGNWGGGQEADDRPERPERPELEE